MLSGHGIEASEWLVTSMSNCIAMKLFNLNLVPRAMPYKPWLRAWACVVAKHTVFLLVVRLFGAIFGLA